MLYCYDCNTVYDKDNNTEGTIIEDDDGAPVYMTIGKGGKK